MYSTVRQTSRAVAYTHLDVYKRQDYDLVVGGVANDKVFKTVELFFDGLIDKTEAISRLRYDCLLYTSKSARI